MCPDVIDDEDVLMIERAGRLRFLFETPLSGLHFLTVKPISSLLNCSRSRQLHSCDALTDNV